MRRTGRPSREHDPVDAQRTHREEVQDADVEVADDQPDAVLAEHPGLDPQGAARRHRVARVDREVHDHLLELAGIGAHRPEVTAVLDDQLDRE